MYHLELFLWMLYVGTFRITSWELPHGTWLIVMFVCTLTGAPGYIFTRTWLVMVNEVCGECANIITWLICHVSVVKRSLMCFACSNLYFSPHCLVIIKFNVSMFCFFTSVVIRQHTKSKYLFRVMLEKHFFLAHHCPMYVSYVLLSHKTQSWSMKSQRTAITLAQFLLLLLPLKCCFRKFEDYRTVAGRTRETMGP